MQDKWALEEHLSTRENNQLWDDSGEAARNGKQYMDYVESHLLDVDERIKIMDATGIERTIVSLTSPGIQSITDTELAVKVAQDTNDLVKSNFVDQRPDRLSMFACLPTQDGTEAAAELRRAVGDLGAVGALINGYTNVTDANTARYLDDDAYEPMWAAVEELGSRSTCTRASRCPCSRRSTPGTSRWSGRRGASRTRRPPTPSG
jgi:gamma-resorcylate decarboxylase